MNIRLICVGKIKEKYLADAIMDYVKRLAPYVRLEIIEVPDEKAAENLSAKEAGQVIEREGAKIAKHLAADAYKIALTISGKPLSSTDLAKAIKNLGISGKSKINFIIGGSLGLAPDIINTAHMQLSLSQMTFTHQLARLILMEQIYRAFRINSNEPYHK